MGTLRRDDTSSTPAIRPAAVPVSVSLNVASTTVSTAVPAPKVRHLKIVPIDPDRSAPPSPAGDDWAALMRRVADQRDREAFGRLFSHFAPRVKSYLIRTGSTDGARKARAMLPPSEIPRGNGTLTPTEPEKARKTRSRAGPKLSDASVETS